MDINELCKTCGKPNDQMLMLKCVHDPCINCAAASYASQIHLRRQSHQIYICEICGTQTVLDGSTVQELKKLADHYIRSPSKKTQIFADTRTQTRVESIIPKSKKKTIYYCRQHQEEEVTYFCHTCSQNICPQCAIHGNHRQHEVQMIKKAIAEAKALYTQKIGKIANFQTSLIAGKQKFLSKIRQAQEKNIREKNILSKQFEGLRQFLLRRQKELLRELDELNKKNIQILTATLQEVNYSYQDSIKLKKEIETLLQKDEVVILSDFKEIHDIDSAISQLETKTQKIEGVVTVFSQNQMIETVRKTKEIIKDLHLSFSEQIIQIKNELIEPSPAKTNNGSRRR